MIKVILAGNYPEQTYEKLRKLLPEQKFELEEVNEQSQFDAVTDAEIIILRIFKAPKEVFERNPKLKMILRWGAGFDSVDIEEAGKRGISVTNTPGANANAVSELTVMLMLALGRKLAVPYGVFEERNLEQEHIFEPVILSESETGRHYRRRKHWPSGCGEGAGLWRFGSVL